MARVVLHVGSPKTGTTAIQKALSNGRDALLQNHSILYPEAAVTDGAAHHNLVYDLGVSPNRFRAAKGGWDVVKETIDAIDPQTVVLSAEGLLRLAPLVARKLRSWVGHEPEVVIYFRRQDEYMEAGYNQLARFGRVDLPPIEHFKKKRPNLLAYRGVIQSWETAFQEITVRCAPYPKQRDIVQDFSDRFLSIPLANDGRPNPRAGLKAIRAIYEVRNQCRAKLGSEYAVRPKTVFNIHNLFRTTFTDTYDYVFVGPVEAESFLRLSEEENRWLAQRFPGFDPGFFFDMTRSQPRGPTVRPGEGPEFSPEEADAVREILAREMAAAVALAK